MTAEIRGLAGDSKKVQGPVRKKEMFVNNGILPLLPREFEVNVITVTCSGHIPETGVPTFERYNLSFGTTQAVQLDIQQGDRVEITTLGNGVKGGPINQIIKIVNLSKRTQWLLNNQV